MTGHEQKPPRGSAGNGALPDDPTLRQLRFERSGTDTSILLIRHGESQPLGPGSPFPRQNGHADPPLYVAGERQAEQVAEHLAGTPLSAIYVSPLTRTLQTAAPLATAKGLDPVVVPDLREVHLGDWEGGEFRLRVRAGDPVARAVYAEQSWSLIPGAEDMNALSERTSAAILQIAARHKGGMVAVFVHAGVIASILAWASGSRPFAFLGSANGAISHIVVDNGLPTLRRFNVTSHLEGDLDVSG